MSREAFIYADYNATTPLDPGVRRVILEALDGAWGNASSIHEVGRTARLRLDEARERIGTVLGCKPSELIFTSGGTEANNLAVLGAARSLHNRGRHLVCSPVEHPAVLQCFQHLARKEGFTLTLLPVDGEGRVMPEDVGRALRPDTVLVSVMAANNETGVLQPVAEIGRLCRDRGILFHTDAVQWFGKQEFQGITDFSADLVSICAHKIHGPKGAGALYLRSPLRLEPLLLGGSHENERRAGTENIAAILGLAESMERFVHDPVFESERLQPWIDRIRTVLEGEDGVHVRSPGTSTLPNTLAFTVEGSDSTGLLAGLDLAGVGASSGSACSVGSLEPSHVLMAMGLPKAVAASLVRLSLGRENTEAEVLRLCEILPRVIRQVRTS